MKRLLALLTLVCLLVSTHVRVGQAQLVSYSQQSLPSVPAVCDPVSRYTGDSQFSDATQGPCAQYPGLLIWLRADSSVAVATGVSSWVSRVITQPALASPFNAIQATGSAQPTLNATDAAFNNQPTISFSAVGLQYLSAPFALSQPYTVIVVAKTSVVASTGIVGGSTGGGTIYIYNASSQLAYNGGTSVGTSSTITSPGVVAAIFNGNGNNSHMYVNNSQTAVSNANGGTTSLSGNFRIGWDDSAIGVATLTGTIAEVMVFNYAMDSAHLQPVFAYLGQRYGISVSALDMPWSLRLHWLPVEPANDDGLWWMRRPG